MLLLTSLGGISQTVFLNQPYDVGLINKSSNRYIDIPIKNIGEKKVFIFRADVDRRFQIRYSSKEILPDSTVYMRVQFTPTKKGPFSEEIKVHFSSYTEPKIVKINGFTESVPSTTIDCPSFTQQSINTSLNFELEVKVIDKETKRPIPKAEVLMINNGLPKETLITNARGEARKKLELGLYYFVTKANGYYTNEFMKYVNRNNNFVLIELEKDETVEEVVITEEIAEVIEIEEPEEVVEEVKVEESTTVIEIEKPIEEAIVETEEPEEIVEVPEVEETVVEETVIEETVVEEVITTEEETPVETYEEEYPEFPLSKYKPSNIVFLVDVSSSMKYTGKLDLLKASMIELTGMIRDIDKVTIVSYADNANVILETTYGNNKDTIISIIQGLKADGFTAGGKGMKKAYQKAEDAFIKGGNNQVIMATDGGFNQGDDDPYKLAKKYKSKGISISVLGIRNKPLATLTLQKVVRYGDGNFVKISTYEDALTALVDEVKVSAKKQ